MPMRHLSLLIFITVLSTAILPLKAAVPPLLKDDKPTCLTDTIPAADKKQFSFQQQTLLPRVAALRSAILPGLGQLYNNKWWKLPLVYGALGATCGIFLYNLRWYNRIRYATNVLLEEGPTAYEKVHPVFQNAVKQNNIQTLRYRRSTFRKDIDYAALIFVLAWALNVVDATVDAHLRNFDVSPDLSFKIKPGYSDLAKTNGISFVLQFNQR